MKNIIEKPEFMKRAGEKGHNVVVEILIFLLIFLIINIVMGIPVGILQSSIMMSDPDILAASMAGDVEKATELLLAATPSWMTVVTLFLTAFEILVPLIYCRFIEKRKLETMGFIKKDMLRQYAIGFGLGTVMVSLPVVICLITGTATFNGVSPTFGVGMFILFLLGYLVQGMAEEVLCRGYLMVSVGRRYSAAVAVIVSSVIFALLHTANPGISVLAMVNLTLFGVFAGMYIIRTGNIWGAAAIHSAWNFFQGQFWGIAVSGSDVKCTVFEIGLTENGKLINGGAFGLEGGLAVTIVLVVGIVILFRMKNKNLLTEETAAQA